MIAPPGTRGEFQRQCEHRRLVRFAARWWARAALLLFCLAPSSCQSPQPQIALPERHSVRSNQLLVLSDFKLPKDHRLIRDLEELRDDVAQTLELPVQQTQVVVYLFSDEQSYREYIRAAFPGLPDRRA